MAQTQRAEDFLGSIADPIHAALENPAKPGSAEDFLSSVTSPIEQKADTTQYTGPFREPAIAGSGLVKGAITGLTTPGNIFHSILSVLPGDLQANYEKNTHDPSLIGPMSMMAPATSEEALGITDKLGITNRADLKPSGVGETLLNAGSEGAGSAIPFLGTGGSAVGNLLAGTTGGIAGEVAHQMAPGSTALPIAAGVLSGVGTQGIVTGVENALHARALTREMTSTAQKVEDAKQTLEAARTGKPSTVGSLKSAAQTIRDNAISTYNATADAIFSGHDKAVVSVADSLGKSVTKQEAGSALQDEARNWVTKLLPKKISDAWAPLDKLIPGETPTPLHAFYSALTDINSSAGKLEPLSAQMKPALPVRLQRAFDSIFESPAATAEQEGKTVKSSLVDAKGNPVVTTSPSVPPEQITWTEVQKLRSTLGDAMSNPQMIKDVGEQNLSRLYATLTADMKSTASGVSKEAATAFDSANAESKRLYDLAEGPFSKVISGPRKSAEDPNPEDIATRLLSGGKKGATDLAALRAEVPKGVDELASAHIRSDFEKGWKALAPEAQNALVPDAGKRAIINTAIAEKGKAGDNLKAAIDTAKKMYSSAISLGMADSNAAVIGARKDLDAATRAAKAARDAFKSHSANGLTKQDELLGTAFGFVGDVVGNHFFPGLIPQGASEAAGMLLPPLYHGAKAVVKNPALLTGPAIGGVAGQNSLYQQ